MHVELHLAHKRHPVVVAGLAHCARALLLDLVRLVVVVLLSWMDLVDVVDQSLPVDLNLLLLA
jgi:hypothetical protein